LEVRAVVTKTLQSNTAQLFDSLQMLFQLFKALLNFGRVVIAVLDELNE
jgi:hypothetical protein